MGCSAWFKAHFLTAWEGRQTRASWVVWGKGQVPLFHPSPSVLKILALSLSQAVRGLNNDIERIQTPAMGVEEPGNHHPSLSPETDAFSLPSASCHATLRSLGGILFPIRAVTKGCPPWGVVTLPKMKQCPQTFCSFRSSEMGSVPTGENGSGRSPTVESGLSEAPSDQYIE